MHLPSASVLLLQLDARAVCVCCAVAVAVVRLSVARGLRMQCNAMQGFFLDDARDTGLLVVCTCRLLLSSWYNSLLALCAFAVLLLFPLFAYPSLVGSQCNAMQCKAFF